MTVTRTRFAPSPTGRLHLGNARTALFSALLALRDQGQLVIRIEDTDAERSTPKHEAGLLEDLTWLGLTWQEGPDIGGKHGPYRQSERQPVYVRLFEKLIADGHAYPCFCSQAELALSRKAQLAAGKPPRYAGTCANLDEKAIAERIKSGRQPTLRFRVPGDADIVFDDLVRGRLQFHSDEIGDFIIRRADGSPAFFFSNAVDDSQMAITHVLRGEDHLANTPRQLMLLAALGLPAPSYGHIGLVTGDDGAPLSKRHGSVSLHDLRTEGYLPSAVFNYLARLGCHFDDERFLSAEELASGFDLARVSRGPAHFDVQQLRHWQKVALMHASDDQIWHWLSTSPVSSGPDIADLVPGEAVTGFVQVIRENIIFPADARHFATNLFGATVQYSGEAKETIRAAGKDFFSSAIDLLENNTEFKSFSKALASATGRKGPLLYLPLRAALSGDTHGPELGRLWTLLGIARIRSRFEQAISMQQTG